MEYKDIYSKYPELATRLIRTSSKLNEISLIGNCNLDISINEMNDIINIKPFAKKAIFNIYNAEEEEGNGLFLDIICFMKMPTENGSYNLWEYNSSVLISVEHEYYHKLTIERNSDSKINLNELYLNIKIMDDIDTKTFDVKSLYLLYSQRKSCLKISNYAKIKTLEIFNIIVDKFSSHNKIVMLNLYLMTNCIILDLDISDDFINTQKEYSLIGGYSYDYNDYVENTHEREDLIKNIISAIEKF
jgi:hypothetical protein